MKYIIIAYVAGYLIVITIAWIRHLKHEGVGVMLLLSSVFLFIYPFILLSMLIERIKQKNVSTLKQNQIKNKQMFQK